MPALAGVAARTGRPYIAAALFGAAATLGASTAVDPHFPPSRETADAGLLAARDALGERDFLAAWELGRSATSAEVAALAAQVVADHRPRTRVTNRRYWRAPTTLRRTRTASGCLASMARRSSWVASSRIGAEEDGQHPLVHLLDAVLAQLVPLGDGDVARDERQDLALLEVEVLDERGGEAVEQVGELGSPVVVAAVVSHASRRGATCSA